MIQMHVDMDPALTLAAAHDIVVEAETRIGAAIPGADVLIHPDPRGLHALVPADTTAVPTSIKPSPEPSPDTAPVAKGPWS